MLFTLVLTDGQRIPIERWVARAWAQQRITDPLLLDLFQRAVRMDEGFGWPPPQTTR